MSQTLFELVLVPEEVSDWLSQTEESLCLKRCGYWLSLRGQPPVDKQTTITVDIPRQNIFSPDVLKTIMSRIADGEAMTAIFPDVEKFQYIDPRQVEAYLVAHGWEKQQNHGDKATI